MSVRVYLVYQQDIVQLPVNPPEVEYKNAGKNVTVDLVKLGEVNLLKKPGLTQISFESHFPSQIYAPYIETFDTKQPNEYVNWIQKAKHALEPCQLVIANYYNDGESFNEFVSIEDFQHKMTPHGDIDYTIEFKIYQPFSAKILDANGKVVSEGRVMTKVVPKTFTAKAGDRLLSIGKKVLGTGAAYQAICKMNGIFDAAKKFTKTTVLKIPHIQTIASGAGKVLNFAGINTKALTLGQIANMASGNLKPGTLAQIRLQTIKSRASSNFRTITASQLGKIKLPQAILRGL